jgi:hypothetical protein
MKVISNSCGYLGNFNREIPGLQTRTLLISRQYLGKMSTGKDGATGSEGAAGN